MYTPYFLVTYHEVIMPFAFLSLSIVLAITLYLLHRTDTQRLEQAYRLGYRAGCEARTTKKEEAA